MKIASKILKQNFKPSPSVNSVKFGKFIDTLTMNPNRAYDFV